MWWLSWWLACAPAPDPEPAGRDSGPVASPGPSGPECDPEISVPAALAATVEPPPADPHREVYGAAPEPYQVRIGWPSSDPSTSVAFLWRTDTETLSTVVEYGRDGVLDQRVEGASFTFGGPPGQPGPYRIHEVKLCAGLEPSTTYDYRVGGDGHWSPTFRFTTPPAPGAEDAFRVAVVGDARGAYETWGEILAALDAHAPDLILFTGDMVDLGANQAEWDDWFGAAGDRLASTPLVPTHGNHEFLATNYFAQFSLPNNEEWYAVRFGSFELVVLNDTVRSTTQITVDQRAYLEATLGASSARWRAAMHHRSPYSTSTVHGSADDLRAAWVPAYEDGGIDLVFAGHNHTYERSVPIRAGAPVGAGEGPVYLVLGGGGAPLYTNQVPEWFGEVFAPTEHYLIGDFEPTGASFVARDLAGNVIDAFVLPP